MALIQVRQPDDNGNTQTNEELQTNIINSLNNTATAPCDELKCANFETCKSGQSCKLFSMYVSSGRSFAHSTEVVIIKTVTIDGVKHTEKQTVSRDSLMVPSRERYERLFSGDDAEE